MAETVSFITREDGGTANVGTTVEVFSGTSTLSLSDWRPQAMNEDDATIIEIMRFRVNGTSDNHLATITQGLAQKAREARWSKEPQNRYQVWLTDQLSGESNPRRAVVHGVKVESGNFWHGYPTRTNHIYEGLTVAVERGHWESTTAGTLYGAAVNAVGGTFAVSNTVGDMSGRIYSLQITSTGGTIEEAWWGIKTSRFGESVGSFTGRWLLCSGTEINDGAVTGDVTAIGGTAVVSNFSAGTAMLNRISLTGSQILGGNAENLRGTYQIILRAKVDSGYVCRARIAHGITLTNPTYHEAVTISSTNWYMYEMGQVTFPCGGPVSQSVASAFANSRVAVGAELYTGTQGSATYLHLDCLIAIPVDGGYGHFEGCTDGDAQISVDPFGRIQAFTMSGVTVKDIIDTSGMSARGCVVPIGAGACVVAGQGGTVSTITDAFTIVGYYMPRWQLLRGSS